MRITFAYLNYLAPDAKALEAELDRRAARGWALQWLLAGLACFRRTERRDLKYCVELLPPEERTDEARQARQDYLDLCADAGWDLIDQTTTFRIFASQPGRDPVPLQTDPALDFEANWKTVLREARWSALHFPLVLAVTLLLHWLFPKGALHWWEVFLSWYALAVVPLLGAILACDIGYFRFLGRFRRSCRQAVKAGEDLPVPRPWAARLRGLLSGAYLPLLILCVVLGLLPSPDRISDITYPGDQYPLVRAEDLGLPSSSESGYLLWEGSELLRHGESMTFSRQSLVRSAWYACRWDWLADVVLESLVREEENEDALHFHPPVAPSPAGGLGFDESWLYDDGAGWQCLLARQGREVAVVEGPVDFTDPAVLAMVRARLGWEAVL